MTGLEAARLIRRLYIKQDTTALPDADLCDIMNLAAAEICAEAEKIDEGFFTRPQTHDLVAGQRTYPLPWEMMNKVEKVSLKFDDWTDYRDMSEVMLTGMNGVPDEDYITAHYTDHSPNFLLRRNAIILLTKTAIPDSEKGLMLWAKVYPAPITPARLAADIDLSVGPTSITVGIPRALQPVLFLRTSILWKSNQQKPVPLTEQEMNYAVALEKAIGSMANQNLDRNIQPTVPTFSQSTGFAPNGVNFIPFA